MELQPDDDAVTPAVEAEGADAAERADLGPGGGNRAGGGDSSRLLQPADSAVRSSTESAPEALDEKPAPGENIAPEEKTALDGKTSETARSAKGKTQPASATKTTTRRPAATSAAAKARAAKAKAARAAAAGSSAPGTPSGVQRAVPAGAGSPGATAKTAPRRPSPARKTSAPKPASQAASLVASTTLAARQSAADDVLTRRERDDDSIPEVDDSPDVGETAARVAGDHTSSLDAPAEHPEAMETTEIRRVAAGRGDADVVERDAIDDSLVATDDTVVLTEASADVDDEQAQIASEIEQRPATSVRVIEPTAAKRTAGDRPVERSTVLSVEGLSKSFDGNLAVDSVDLAVRAGSIFGIVGPNGAGKTTTLSMVTGLLRPDAGRVLVHGADVWKDPVTAKRNMGVLPDRLRLFDRLTGGQLLYYSGSLRGLDRATVRSRSADLAVAFGLEDALSRLVTDYSAGMTKKIALAAAMIHSPRLLILDEPFEAVDPVSAANVIEILQKYAAAGGTVVMSSHSMDLIQRICDSVTIIVHGEALASGTMDEVRDGGSLEDRFVKLAGGRKAAEGMEWLHSFSG